MNKSAGIFLWFIAFFCAIGYSVVCASLPVWADCGGASTIIIDCGEDEDTGGIFHVLNLVVDILGIGVGTIGVIGILVFGIKYLTAGDNEEKAKSARRRMKELVIGIVIYAVLYAAVSFLLLGNLSNNDTDGDEQQDSLQVDSDTDTSSVVRDKSED